MMTLSRALLVVMISSYPCMSLPRQDRDRGILDSYIARQARRERGEEYREAREEVAGDLNHDGVADVAVLYTIESQRGTNDYVQYLAVFLRSRGGLVAVTHAAVGGPRERSIEHVSIEADVIRLETLSYTARDPACCPSEPGMTHYVLVGRRLREQ